MKKFLWTVLMLGIFVAALAAAQEPPKPAAPHGVGHGIMQGGGAGMHGTMGPMAGMDGMMEKMRSMTPEDRAKMIEHCQQMMAAAAAQSDKSDK